MELTSCAVAENHAKKESARKKRVLYIYAVIQFSYGTKIRKKSRNYGFLLRQIKEISDGGTEVGIVIGGGNIFRGLSGTDKGFDRVRGDQMGMLATVINSLALQSALAAAGKEATVFTAVNMYPIGEHYSKHKAIQALKEGKVAIMAGGTGNPYFTTDTASALRGVEIEADVMLKGTRVDGIYTADPEKDRNAVKFDRITYDEIYARNLRIMDLTATTLCRENSRSKRNHGRRPEENGDERYIPR